MAAQTRLSLDEHLEQLQQTKSVRESLRGVEKESLRITGGGALAMTPHPEAFGSKLTHPDITTDFSEAQLELITTTHTSVRNCLQQLDEIHRYASGALDHEYLWPLSMPCVLGQEKDIPLADYGDSNPAMIKSIYRRGLGNRYGRLMQTISGIHYNFSFSARMFQDLAQLLDEEHSVDFVNNSYMHVIRNFRRNCWLLIWLFGASPAVCGTFVPPTANHNLERLDEGSFFRPDATSLRMGPLGYQSDAQSDLYVTYNSLIEYLQTLRDALTKPYPKYQSIGIKKNSRYEQLNDALLQIEAEFYSPIRPKRKTNPDERPFTALWQRGIEWLEVRCLDIDPFIPCGVAEDTLQFVDAFLLYCLLTPSPLDNREEYNMMLENQLNIVHNGGAFPDLKVGTTATQPFRSSAKAILDDVLKVGLALDAVHETNTHELAIQNQMAKVHEISPRPAQRVLRDMRAQNRTFSQYGMHLAREHLKYFQANPLPDETLIAYAEKTRQSNIAQRQIEESNSESFDSYLTRFMQLPEIS